MHGRNSSMVDNYIVLDIETTGLHIPRVKESMGVSELNRSEKGDLPDEILQLAIVDQAGVVLFYDSFSPTVRKSWKEAQRTHHISPKDVEQKQPFSSRLAEIQSIIKEAPLIVAYNAPFDFGFLQGQGVRLTDKPYVCAMEAFSRIYGKRRKYGGGWEWQSLQVCANHYGLKNNQAHDSLADAQLTLACFKAMLSDTRFPIRQKPWK